MQGLLNVDGNVVKSCDNKHISLHNVIYKSKELMYFEIFTNNINPGEKM